jgi:hypothetical protein
MSDQINQALLAMIGRMTAQSIANSIIGVSPMTGPTSQIFNMRMRYADEHRIKMLKEHYRVFLRINDRPKTQILRVFTAAGYPTVHMRSMTDVIKAGIWCRDQYGPYGYQKSGAIFIFKDEADATLFRMRWL